MLFLAFPFSFAHHDYDCIISFGWTDLPATCRTQQEEIFGPVVGITTFKTEEEGTLQIQPNKKK
jgi:hypothetical protein